MQTVKIILGRIKTLIIKLISVKGAAFIIASIALLCGTIQSTEWLIVSAVVIGGRAAEKILGKTNGNI